MIICWLWSRISVLIVASGSNDVSDFKSCKTLTICDLTVLVATAVALRVLHINCKYLNLCSARISHWVRNLFKCNYLAKSSHAFINWVATNVPPVDCGFWVCDDCDGCCCICCVVPEFLENADFINGSFQKCINIYVPHCSRVAIACASLYPDAHKLFKI